MIQKATSSEVFDIFTKTMRRYNIKKKANWFTSALETMSETAKPLEEVLSELGKSSDDFIVEAYKSGFTMEEIYKFVPGTTVDHVSKLIAKSVPTAVDTAQGISDASKLSTELNNTLTQSYQDIMTSGKSVLDLFTRSKDLTGKSADEIIDMYEGLKRSRNSLKGSVTKLKNDLTKAQESAQISAEELAKRNKAVLQGEALLKDSEIQVANLGKKITELGGQLDESGNVIKGLQDQLNSAKQELDLAQKTIADLSQQGIVLSSENKKALETALEKAELAGYYKALYEELKKINQEDSVIGRVAATTANQAQIQSAQVIQTITQVTPAAKPAVNQAANTATNAGAAKAVSAAQNPAPSAPPAQPVTPTAKQTPATPASPAATPIKPSGNTPATPPNTPTNAPGNTTPPIAPIKTPGTPTSQPNTPPTKTPANPTPSKPNAKSITPAKAFKERLENLVLMGSIGSAIAGAAGTAGGMALSGAGALAGAAVSVLPYVAIIGLAGGGMYLLWKNYLQTNPEVVSQELNTLLQSEYDAIASLKQLKFKKDSQGQEITRNLIDNLSSSVPYVSKLNDPNISEEELQRTAEGLDHLIESIDSYIQKQERISQDLVSPNGFDEVIASLQTLKSNSQQLKQHLLSAAYTAEKPNSSRIPERGLTSPVGRAAPSPEELATEKKPSHVPSTIFIQGEPVDIGNLSPGMRSAATTISELLKTPEGLAFIDPDRIWGGWLPQTPVTTEDGQIIQDKKADYLRALKFLYLNKVFNRQDLRKFMRQNLPKAGRKRMSGWNNAIKYYKGQQNITANQENNEIFTQKFAKPANNDTSSVIYDNRIILNMRKKADQFSKEYFQEAVSGLEDQYAKSYYAGLKGMYDQKLSKTEPDYKSLYEIHNESGNALIGSAHPETIDLVEAMGNGGIVENQIEQHRHNQGVAQSMPTGNFRNRNAWIIQSLVKLADQVDEQGLKEASDLIDAALKELTS